LLHDHLGLAPVLEVGIRIASPTRKFGLRRDPLPLLGLEVLLCGAQCLLRGSLLLIDMRAVLAV
jgi:hypothetical protein